MLVCLFIKMLCILVLCPVLLVAVQTLTIDSQLGTSIEDCFERITIGEQLPNDAIYRNVSELTTRECEQICKQDKQCQTYDYGVGAKGNATCNLSNIGEKEIKEKGLLRRHPDYDVYVRRFQCEQSPPTPIQAQFDDPEGGPIHRPVFRPDEDDPKRPLADEYPITDIRPYDNHRPNKPGYNYIDNDRPDDFTSSKPTYDRPPSYGAHTPPEIPYLPENPYQKPNKKPNHYDVLQFQDPYRPSRPHDPGYYRPDPHYPSHPNDDIPDLYGQRPSSPNRPFQDPYLTEKPVYHYIIRPNRKPRPQGDTGYGLTTPRPHDYPIRPDPYGQNDIGHPSGPIGPPYRPYKPNRPYDFPSRPYDRPDYSYNSQYASNYGQSSYGQTSNYNDNSIYLEIYDPPRLYKPNKPLNRPNYGQNQGGYGQNFGYGQSSYGFGSSHSQDTHSHTHSSQSQYYGTGTITEIDNNNKPSHDSGYRPNYHRPISDTGYGVQKPSYDSQTPSYDSNKPIYDTHRPIYDSHKPSHDSQSGYGDKPSYNRPEHDTLPGYGNNKPHYDTQKPGYDTYKPNYDSYKPSLDTHKPDYDPGYGNEKPSYDTHRPGYNSNKPVHDTQKPGYGSSSFDQGYGSQSGYGLSQKPNDPKPSYGNNQEYGSSQSDYSSSSGYGSSSDSVSNRPTYGSNQDSGSQSGYGLQTTKKPNGSYYKPAYNDQPSYGISNDYSSNQGSSSYGSSNSFQDSISSSYGGSKPSYSGSKPTYGSNPNFDSQSYGQSHTSQSYGSSNQFYGETQGSQGIYGNKPSYADDRPYRPSYIDDRPFNDNRPTYGSNRPIQDYNRPTYSNNRPSQDNNRSPYINNRPDPPYADSPEDPQNGYKNSGYKPKPNESSYQDKPDIKPVYEYELDKPSDVPSYIVRPGGEVITSRPVTIGDYGEREWGGRPVSYKACFRRVLAGRRALRSFVRRVINCERLEDCRRECATERRFPCESFNYRLDTSFRGKGLCELMTKPIEAFDIQRDFVDDKDYDFFEVDRNSLEPNCPDSLKGSGILHSGFLSSKNRMPEYDWDRSDWHGRYNSYDRYDRRGFKNNGRRGYQEQFIPYQIGTGIARSNDDQENWGQYGGNYGNYDTYYKDRNDYFNSINHWRLAQDLNRPYHGVKPHQNTNFDYQNLGKDRLWENHRYGTWKRGRWNTSGSNWNNLDYEESNYYKRPQIVYDERNDDVGGKDCSSRRRPGMSLGTGAIRRSLIAHNVVECEAACFGEREFKCVSYSYKYSSSRGTDNCFLSERPYRGLELSADSGSDVYAMPQDQGCSVINHKPWVESECFWHVRSGAAVSGSAIRATITVAGLGACEAECIRAHGFFCRGFSFRFDAPTIGDDLENCILTSSPPTSLEANRGLRPTAGHELYSRGNYGRGCEPALYDDVQPREPQCYLQYDSAARLKESAVRGSARVRDEETCGKACTDAPFRCLSFSYNNHAPHGEDNCLLSEIRLFDLQRGVDYEHSTDDWLFAFDLFNGQCWRKVHGKNEYDRPSPELPRPLPPPIEDHYPVSSPGRPGYPPSSGEPAYIPASGPPSGPGYKPGYPNGPEPPKPYPEPSGPAFKPTYPDISAPDYRPTYPDTGPGYKPGYLPEPGQKPIYRPIEPNYPDRPGYQPGFKPGFRPEPSGPGYKPNYPPDTGFKPAYPPDSGFKPGYPPPEPGPGYKPGYPESGRPYEPRPEYGPPGRPNRPGYPGDREEGGPINVSWRHYTVSGFPCRTGTTCAQNQVTGHWACEPEGGEVGSWDYCCSPTHRCGYSEGFHKPWCYVGPTEDQWRPCSDKYYPYHQHNVPHPSQGHKENQLQPYPSRPWRERPPYKDNKLGDRDKPFVGPYLSETDRRYWDELYKNGPQAYYDKYGNPLPGYTRVPTADRPYIKYRHSYPRPPSGHWVPVSPHDQQLDPPVPGGFGAPRYWPVAYLHKGPPPNITYFRYNETQPTSSTERYDPRPQNNPRPQNDPRPETDLRSQNDLRPQNDPRPQNNQHNNQRPEVNPQRDQLPPNNNKNDLRDDKNLPVESRSQRDERPRKLDNDTGNDDLFHIDIDKLTTTTTPKIEVKTDESIKPEVKEDDVTKTNNSIVEMIKPENVQAEKDDELKLDDKLVDFSTIEVLDIEDAKKGEKLSDLKTLEAEEKQIEAIGRLLASRRGTKLIIEKRSQKDLEAKSIAVDKDLVDFNFGNKFPTTERRGTIQRVTKDEIEREKNNDKSLEVSETTFVRPPRVLSTTENIRKAIVNGKVFYDATIREQRDIFSNITRKAKSFRHLDDIRAPSIITNSTYGKKKIIKARNVNPVRRVRRVYRKRYNPEEVRRRLLERERSMKMERNIENGKNSKLA